MTRRCSQCGRRIKFLENWERISGRIFCIACAEKYHTGQEAESQKQPEYGFSMEKEALIHAIGAREQAQEHPVSLEDELREQRSRVIEAVRKELGTETPPDGDLRHVTKLDVLRDLLQQHMLTTAEFDALKSALLQHWSQDSRHSRFAKMYEQAKELISAFLVAPATTQYPPLELKMITFTDCDSNELVINIYVDSQNSFSAMVRSQFRAKFDIEDDKCIGISFFQDANPPMQKMEWGPYALPSMQQGQTRD